MELYNLFLDGIVCQEVGKLYKVLTKLKMFKRSRSSSSAIPISFRFPMATLEQKDSGNFEQDVKQLKLNSIQLATKMVGTKRSRLDVALEPSNANMESIWDKINKLEASQAAMEASQAAMKATMEAKAGGGSRVDPGSVEEVLGWVQNRLRKFPALPDI